MVFRRRFQSGTLGRSIRRFGRFPRGPGFQRKKFGFYYATSFQQQALTANADPIVVSLVSNDELVPATSVATGAQVPVNNISVDALMIHQVLPTLGTQPGDVFGFLYTHWMIFKQDVDEDVTTFSSAAATNSAIKWGAWPWSIGGTGTPGGANMAAVVATMYQQTTRVRFRVSRLEKDEELIFLAARSQSEALTGYIDGYGVQLILRVRYEIP